MTRNLLITNDDGIDAPGILALQKAVAKIGSVRVVAPAGAYSGCGHVVTTHEDIAISRRDERTYAVSGTPADCVRLSIHHLCPDFDWIVSGINQGGNLGADVHHSGTVAAVREGAIHGRPGIAISHYVARGKTLDWERASQLATRVIAELIERPWQPGTFWNVNLPHNDAGGPEPEMILCSVDPSPLPLTYEVREVDGRARYRGVYQDRLRKPGKRRRCVLSWKHRCEHDSPLSAERYRLKCLAALARFLS